MGDEDTTDYSGYGDATSQDLIDTTTTAGAGDTGVTQDDYDFWQSIGVNPDTTMENWTSPTNAQIEAALQGNSTLSGMLATYGTKALDLLKTNGSYDPAKIAPLLGGLYAASQSNTRTQPSGYQGKIPTYTATRQAPGIGQLLSGNVTYAKPDGTVINPNSLAPATAVAPVENKAMGGSLSSGGFVIPADVVSHFGNGSSAAGLQLLQQHMGAQPIKGQGDGMSDSIKTTIDGRQPARVANEEAHLSKPQVDAMGGAQKLYAMMDRIRQARTGSKDQGSQIDPSKFLPGGANTARMAAGGMVQRFETGGVPAGTTGTESSLSNWAGDYVTNMLGKGQALSEMPYEQYQGPLTAGASDLQNKVSTGLGSLNFPGNLGGSFSSATAPTIGAGGQPTGGTGIASNYMNPYLSAVLNPQLDEMRRQAQINNLSGLGSFTKSGAFGGGRQAIMESETARNLAQEQNKAIGQGYSNAYDKGMQQFNTEQGQAKDLAGLMAQQGAVDRGITGEGIAAQQKQFEEARLNPYKMVQFQQSLLSGLPLTAQTYNQAPTNNLTQFSDAATTISNLLKTLGQGSTTTTPK